MKRFVLAFALVLAVACNNSPKSATGNCNEKPITIWEDPGITDHWYLDGDRFPLLSITKVEFYEHETRLYAELRCDKREKLRFSKKTYLDVNGTKYFIQSAEGVKLSKKFKVNETGKIDLVFHFSPLPADTESFDFIEGRENDFFCLKKIQAPEIRHKNFYQSYWRNDKTGNWDIAFYNDRIIYDCKFWEYEELPDITKVVKDTSYTVHNGNDTLTFDVGEYRNGKRTISINGVSEEYSMFNCQFIPDYPVKDERDSFLDTNFSKIDTVTFNGWLRGWPMVFEDIPEVSLICSDISVDDHEEITYACKADTLGRFSIKVPLLNTTSFYFKSGLVMFQTVLEPGQSYFLMYDFGEGRHFFMGKDARLQNEMLKSELSLYVPRMEDGDNDFDTYMTTTEKSVERHIKCLDSLMTANPNFSNRFYKYHKDEIYASQACGLGATAHKNNWILNDKINDYLYERFWNGKLKPYSLHREYNWFIYYFMLSQQKNCPMELKKSLSSYEPYVKDTRDRVFLNEYNAKWDAFMSELEKIDSTDTKHREEIANKFNEINKDTISRICEIIKTPSRIITYKFEIDRNLKILDSLGTDDVIRDIVFSKYFHEQLDWRHESLPNEILDSVKTLIRNPIFVDKIIEKNNVYVALENGTFDSEAFNTNNIDLNGVSEGKELLDKLLEPHKGKVVLLDIWGTWCGPCKERLSHSAEEYAALADYNVVYLYLANNSPEQSWKNIIREYNVKGDNVFHYNLPSEQQSAIENYLNAHSYPTYKLFDTKGNLVPVDVNVWDLEGLKELVRKIYNNK